VYGFPLERATKIAVREVRAFLDKHKQIDEAIFACFGSEALEIYQATLAEAAR
jgi:O-acetyl-ADP-ribose deacetylase (regulator of RNase III)